ncbi:Pilus assembly, Flp-type CpaB [Candidatus Magnetomorum sp. HK-1]|nr:Pilus assembly, Flp-type CpaB [Candidatus Magnetomorum sp. HK-1]
MTESKGLTGKKMNRKQSVIFFLVAIIFASMAAYVSRLWIASEAENAQRSQIKTASVVVAVQNMKKGHVLKKTDLAVQQWPLKNLPKGFYSRIIHVEEKLTQQEIIKGQAIVKSAITDNNSAFGLSSSITDGKRAITIPVDEVVGVAGFVQPNDRVDVIATVDIGPYKEFPTTQMMLQNVKVLAVGEKIIEDKNKNNKKKKKSPKPIRVKVVTLEVEPKDTQNLALISSQCRLHLALCHENMILQKKVVNEAVKKGINIQSIFPKPIKKKMGSRKTIKKIKKVLPPKNNLQIVEVIKGSTRSQVNF